MRAVVYTETGPSSVLHLVDLPDPEPGPGEVVVRLVRAGVNPTDWKFRAGHDAQGPRAGRRPARTAPASSRPSARASTDVAVGDRVWLRMAQHGRPIGTAAELTVQPADQVAPLPDGASYDVGASLGVPAAHRAPRAVVRHGRRPGRAGLARLAHRAGRRRRGRGRQRRDPARRLGRRHRGHHRQQRREGRAGPRRRRPPRARLHDRGRRGAGPRDRPRRRRPRRRGRSRAEPRPRPRGRRQPRHHRVLRQQRRRRGHGRRCGRASPRTSGSRGSCSTPSPPDALRRRRRGRQRRGRGRGAAGGGGRRGAAAPLPARGHRRRPRRGRAAAPSARC